MKYNSRITRLKNIETPMVLIVSAIVFRGQSSWKSFYIVIKLK